jgi:gluconolactonase
MQTELLVDGLEFPEGPIAMPDGSVILVEIVGQRLTRVWNGQKEKICDVPGAPTGAALGPDGAIYICNLGGIDLARGVCVEGPGNEGRTYGGLYYASHDGKMIKRVFHPIYSANGVG